MANFIYKAITDKNVIVEGNISAKSKEEAAGVLSKKNLSLLTIKPVREKVTIKGSVPAIDKIVFCRYLSTMLSSGLSINEGIDVLLQETKHPLMKRILGDLTYSLEQGQQLSTVFEHYPNVFEKYFLTLTHAGEVSGNLAEVFKYLEAELRSEYSLNSKVKGALLYPTIVFMAMVAIGSLMFFFVLPQIAKVFLNLKMPLPAFTRAMFTFSLMLSKQMVPILISVVILAILFFMFSKKPWMKNLIFYLIRPIPMVRNLIKKIDMARFNRIFSTLLKSAVPITEALEISLEALSWYEYRSLSKSLPGEIRKGKSLSEAVKANKVFPSLVIQLVAAGEKSGTLDTTLGELATFYEGEVEEELKNLTQIIEPVLMLLVGISVGVMILSIIAPIYSVVGSFQQAAGGPGGMK